MKKAVLLFSGGLDSVVAGHLLKKSGVDVLAVHFLLPFVSGLGMKFNEIKKIANSCGVELKIIEEGGDFLDMVKNPTHGYGKHVNPCIDCRIFRLKNAAKLMREFSADFIATGEVVGQRPMSQRVDALNIIARDSNLKGLILRPLSAKLLPETIPEKEGWVSRENLLDIGGRGRQRQLAYAKEHNLLYGSPGGGCLLTEKETARKFRDLAKIDSDFSLDDFKMLAYGRHFMLSEKCKVVIGRNESENGVLEKLTRTESHRIFKMVSGTGPYSIGVGIFTRKELEVASGIIASYTKARSKERAEVEVCYRGKIEVISVVPRRYSDYFPK